MDRVEGANAPELSKAIAKYSKSTSSSLNGPATATPSVAPPTMSPEEMNARLKELTSSSAVMAFIKGTPTAPRCQFSRQLLEILTAQNIRFSSFNILADDEVRQAMKTFSDWPTFPQVKDIPALISCVVVSAKSAQYLTTFIFSLNNDLGVRKGRVCRRLGCGQGVGGNRRVPGTCSSRKGSQDPHGRTYQQGSSHDLYQGQPRDSSLRVLKVRRNQHFFLNVFVHRVGVQILTPFFVFILSDRKLVALLADQEVTYDSFDILEDDDIRQGLKTHVDWPTFPMVFFKGELLGGLDIVTEMVENGEFQQVVAEAKSPEP